MQEYKIVALGLAEKIASKAAEWMAEQGHSLSVLDVELDSEGDSMSVDVAVDAQASAIFLEFVRGRYTSRFPEGLIRVYRREL